MSDDSVIELTPDEKDIKDMTPEEVAHMGEPVEGLPELSEITFVCPTCSAQESPVESDVYFIDKPEAVTILQPKFEKKTGIYRQGFKKLILPLRCEFGHQHTLTFNVPYVFDLGK